MLCINSQIQPEGQHSAVDRFLGRSVLNFIPNSFNDQFVWQEAIKARAQVRERRVNRPSRGCKEAFSPGQPVLLQDHISRKWDISGKISKIRQAPDGKILSYEILTDKGHLTTRHRSMIKSVPNVNNESNNIPGIIDDDDSGEVPNTDVPATWSRGDRLRAKKITIHEAEEAILKNSIPVEQSQQHEADELSSPVEQSQQRENFLNQASRSNMIALSALSSFSNQVSAAATLSSTARESPALPADSEKGIATKPSRADPALRENSMVSTIAKERRAPSTNRTSYRGFDKGSQGGLLSVDQVLASPQVSPGSLSLVDRVKEQICWWSSHITITAQEGPKMPKASCSGTCCLILYAVGMTVGFMIAVVVCIATNGDCQQIHNGKNVTDFQEAQTKQTFFEANFFSQVQDKGAEMNKMEDKGGCPEWEQRLPPLLLGLHFLELVALALLTLHSVFHCHTLGVYLKQAYQKRQQRHLELELAKAEEEKAKLKIQVDKEVAARMKEKVGSKFNPDISLEA